jgi:predicted enzyme related to lactoylglutathione lyase
MSIEKVKAGGAFIVQCFDSAGNLKWTEENHNLVVNVGLKDMNDKYFSGSAYTAAWYIGLYGAAATNDPAAGDTMASHAGWTEVTDYTEATRRQAVFGAATTADPSVISNSGSVAVFSINGTTTVGGAFLTSNDTKGGTTGVLFSASDFAAPGDRAVVSGDVINVTYTFSLDAA